MFQAGQEAGEEALITYAFLLTQLSASLAQTHGIWKHEIDWRGEDCKVRAVRRPPCANIRWSRQMTPGCNVTLFFSGLGLQSQASLVVNTEVWVNTVTLQAFFKKTVLLGALKHPS